MITGPRMSRKDLVLSEIWGSEDIVGRPSSVLFLSQVQAWRKAKCLYSCGLRNNDDWYWLYAAVRGGAGTLLVSNDEMRDPTRDAIAFDVTSTCLGYDRLPGF